MIYKNNITVQKDFFEKLSLSKEKLNAVLILADIMEELRNGDENALVKYRKESQQLFGKMYQTYNVFPTDMKHRMIGLQARAQSTIDQFIVLLAKGSTLIHQNKKRFKEYVNPVKKEVEFSPLLEEMINIYISPKSLEINAVTDKMTKVLASALEVLANEKAITM